MIYEGGYFLDGSGDKHGPMVWEPRGWFYVEDKLGCWYSDGTCEDSATERSIGPLVAERSIGPLVAEWTDGPVRTVTRREVVPGLYGLVSVCEGPHPEGKVLVHMDRSVRGASADELQAAAAVLLELAGALEE